MALTRKLSKKFGNFHFYSDFSFPPCFLLILSMPFTIRILTPITPISPQTSSLDSLLNAYLETLRYQERLFALLCRNYASEIAPQCGSKPAFKSSYKETPKQVRPRMPFWRKKSDKKQFEKHVSSPSLHPLPSLAAELRERKEKKHLRNAQLLLPLWLLLLPSLCFPLLHKHSPNQLLKRKKRK